MGAAAGERKAGDEVGREVAIHAGSEAEGLRVKIGRADDRIATGVGGTAIARTPGGPAIIEYGGARRRLEHAVVGKRDVGRETRRPIRRKASALPPGGPLRPSTNGSSIIDRN